MDPLKYIFQKPMPTDKLSKWQILLSEFDIVYVTQKAVKGQLENVLRWSSKLQRSWHRSSPSIRNRSALSSHPDKNFIDPIPVKIHDQPAYYAHTEEKANRKPWFHDIKEYLAKGEYPELANPVQKYILRRLSNNFFHSGGILYRRTLYLGLLRYVDAKETSKLLEEIHAGTCSPHMNGFVLAKKILRAGYFG
ncbi:uncharacterized protein [Nicotiana sylvestris]|uniref:uncharacterized protein n=1 Tax=Nicotiana sylvestris TaxID=4096 RepID=UPI00388CDD39